MRYVFMCAFYWTLCDRNDSVLLFQIFTMPFLDFQAMAHFMAQTMGSTVSFDPLQIVLTAGATPALEILCFCLADHGNALLVPTPYYPG